jgi:hypothetical protein
MVRKSISQMHAPGTAPVECHRRLSKLLRAQHNSFFITSHSYINNEISISAIV